MKKISKALLLMMFIITCIVCSAIPFYGQDDSVPIEKMDKSLSVILYYPNLIVNGAGGGYQELIDGMLTRPYNDNGLAMMPLNNIIKYLNGHYTEDLSTGVATIAFSDQTLTIQSGSAVVVLNGQPLTAPRVVVLKDEAIFVPFRFVMEALGFQVDFNKARNMITITGTVDRVDDIDGYSLGGDMTLNTLEKRKSDWYGTDQSKLVAQTIVGYQNADGGWQKFDGKLDLTKKITRAGNSTIDNDATFMQMLFLSKMYKVTKDDAYKESYLKALDYVLDGQYENGGWTQFFPVSRGYQKYITLNDNALTNVLEEIRDVINNKDDLFSFVDEGRMARCKLAYNKGIDFLLKSQIIVNGKKTVWCAQYDPITLAPAGGRAYELPSLSGQESVHAVRFLMSIDNPSDAVIDSIQSAMAWFDQVKIVDKDFVKKYDPTLEFGYDNVVVDSKGKVLWARFYEIGTNKPLFADRDGIPRYNLSDISYERRSKYSWYSKEPHKLFDKEYPEWRKKNGTL